MRLNKILLLAATINVLILALVLISCGSEGSKGADGKACYVDPSGDNSWNVFCGSKQIGVLKSNDEGEPGPQGNPGAQGAQGSYCLLGSQTANGFEILCDGQAQGYLDGCSIESFAQNEYQFKVSCGKNKINVCNGQVYDTLKTACTPNGDVTSDLTLVQGTCGSKTYTKSTEYCGYATKEAAASKTESVLKLCGYDIKGISPKPLNKTKKDVFLISDPAECSNIGGTWDSSAGECSIDEDDCTKIANGVYDGSSSKCEYLVSEWKDEYCRYFVYWTATPFTSGAKQKISAKPTDVYCGNTKTDANAINKDSWKGQYCGWKTNNDKSKSVVSGVCDDYGRNASADGWNDDADFGPDQKGNGKGYCEVTKTNYEAGINKTIYSEDLCGILDNGILMNASKSKKNAGSWKNEYCGYVKGTTTSGNVPYTTVMNDMCDDLNGPKENEADLTFGYCQYDKTGKSKRAGLNERCDTRKEGSTTAQSTGNQATINAEKWNREYCGWTNSSMNQKKVYKDSEGVCDDGLGAYQDTWAPGYCQAQWDEDTKTFKTKLVPNEDGKCDDGSSINEGSWKGEYCGKVSEDSPETTKQQGACDTGKGPNSESVGGGYCVASRPDAKGKTYTSYTADFCGGTGTPNNGSWNGEYCGKNEDPTGPDKVYAGVCDDGDGPNSDKFGGGYCQAVDPEADPEKAGTTETSTDFCDGVKYNEGTWKAEYCFKGDNKVATCTGGFKPVIDKSSTDPFSVRCIFQNDFVCSTSQPYACDKDACADLGATYVWDNDYEECREVSAAPKGKRVAKKVAKK